jgi:uncharacterized protein (UPF0303 family)
MSATERIAWAREKKSDISQSDYVIHGGSFQFDGTHSRAYMQITPMPTYRADIPQLRAE